MTLTLARRVVLDAVKNPAKSGFALATPPLTRRYDWLARMFVPALRLLGRPGTKVSRGLMAHGYFLLGDILSVQLGAQHAPIKAYRVAARWQPRSARIWSEIGLEYSALDNLQEALRAYGKAKRYATNEDDRKEFADDIVRLEERAEARGHRKRRGIYLFPDDLAFESIAEFKPMRALEILQRPRTVEALMARAAAYSALGDIENCLLTWERVASTLETVEFGASDFYLFSATLDRSPRFWQAMRTIAQRASGLALSGFCWGVPRPTGASKMTLEEVNHARFALVCEYRYALRARDAAIMKDLKRRYPRWKQLRRH